MDDLNNTLNTAVICLATKRLMCVHVYARIYIFFTYIYIYVCIYKYIEEFLNWIKHLTHVLYANLSKEKLYV